MQRAPAVVVSVLVVGSLTACAVQPRSSDDPDGALITLAKVAGWQSGYQGDEPYSMLEVAYDDATAEQLWTDEVPADLPRASGTSAGPAEPGVYGDLSDVDLATHVVVVWSSGESGSCPEWLTGLSATDDGVVPHYYAGYDECTADYNPYRLVLAVPRDDLPAQDRLPVPIVHPGIVIDQGQVRVYGD